MFLILSSIKTVLTLFLLVVTYVKMPYSHVMVGDGQLSSLIISQLTLNVLNTKKLKIIQYP